MGQPGLRDFDADLAAERRGWDAFDRFYAEIWPGAEIRRNTADMDAQRAGVDVVVVGVRRNPLQGIGCWRGRYRIDEKDRRFNPDGTLAKDYGDMFVECAMDYGDRIQLGWSLDPKKVTDLVVYATVRHVTLIHYRSYRAFCREEIPRWRKSVRRTRSRRGDSSWTTYHASVGWRELARHATCVQWAWSPPAWTIEQRVGLTT